MTIPKPRIVTAEAAEQLTGEGCHIREVWNDELDPFVSVALARVVPGMVTALHVLAVDERYLVERGRGMVEVEGLGQVEVSEGDAIVIPAGRAQRITNTGSEDLIFSCVCTPRFESRHYRELEPARRVEPTT